MWHIGFRWRAFYESSASANAKVKEMLPLLNKWCIGKCVKLFLLITTERQLIMKQSFKVKIT